MTSDYDVDRYTNFVMSASQDDDNTFAIIHIDDVDNLSLLCVNGNVVKSTLSKLKHREFISMLDECI